MLKKFTETTFDITKIMLGFAGLTATCVGMLSFAELETELTINEISKDSQKKSNSTLLISNLDSIQVGQDSTIYSNKKISNLQNAP